MSSLLWYICLSVIGVGTAAFTIFKKKHIYKISTLIVFYLFATSITWFGEFTVLGIFNSYAYKPGIFSDPWAENLAGHLLLNSTIWPGAATLMAAYSLGYAWFPLIIAFFIFAEGLFLKLGIYDQHWWRYYMSVIIVSVFLVVAKKWFAKIINLRHRLPRTIIFYFVAFVIIHFPVPLLLLFGKQYYSLDFVNNIFGNLYWASTIFIYTYQIIETFFLVYFVCILDKWFWKLVPFFIAIAGQSILAKMNILIFQDGWNLLYALLIYVMSLAVFMLIEKYTLKPSDRQLIK
jgi:hypothetical protein